MGNHTTSQRPSYEGGSVSQQSERNLESYSSVGDVSIDVPVTTTNNNTTSGCSEAVDTSSTPSSMPHPTTTTTASPMHIEDLPPPKPDFTAPPPYEVAAKLPTYEEVQREKNRLGEPQINNSVPSRPAPQSLAFLAIDSEGHENENESGLLGTDFMFFTAFLVAFLFNWIGFLLLMCFCHTIAARYGALSGFGLSLAKWTLIVKHSTDLASRENSWLWWLIMAFGLLIFVRAIIQYLNIKRGWRLLSGTAQERLLFFY